MALRNTTSGPIVAEYVDAEGEDGKIELGPGAAWYGDESTEIGAVIAAQLEAGGATSEDD